MSQEISIPCPRCNASTKVTLNMAVSAQRCMKCGNFLYSADTGTVPVERRRGKRRHWRSLSNTAALEHEMASLDPDFEGPRRKSYWLPLTALAACCILVGIVYQVIDRERTQSRASQATTNVVSGVLQTSLQGKSKQATQKRLPLGDFSLTAQEIDPVWAKLTTEAAVKFLSTVQIQDVLELVRDRPKYEAEIRAQLSETGKLPLSTAGIGELLYSVPEEAGGKPLGLLFFQNRQDRSQGLVLCETPEGVKIDWPSLSGSGEMSVEEFLQKKPTKPTLLRVAARRTDYLNFEFSDAKELQPLRLTEFPERNVLYGYVSVKSPFIEKARRLPMHDSQVLPEQLPPPSPLTIRAQFRPGSKSTNQVDIVEVLGNGWFVR